MSSFDPEVLKHLTPAELATVDQLLTAGKPIWEPLSGPQTAAYESEADIVGYGGAAGGGKTDLACGKALTQHRKVGIFRLNGTELTGVQDRLVELVGSRDGYNGKDNIWRMKRGDGVPLQIELGSFPNPGDERKYQGRPHDLLVFDEAANMPEERVRFLLGWLRSVEPGQRCQALLTFNPPTSAEGRWIVVFFAPWLDKKHPNPAQPGELRWFATVSGEDIEVPTEEPFLYGGEFITPLSRTFIPSRIADNPHLVGTGYMAVLQALPEPLRSQMLYGDFSAGVQDDPWQVIPTAWVELAQSRWRELSPKPEMLSLGVDVARGGEDNTLIARRHAGMWFDVPLVYPGTQTPDGPKVAGLTIAATRDRAPQHIDVIGVGASPYDFLIQSKQQCLGINASEKATSTDKSGRLKFYNLRTQLWWKFREALDPDNNTGIALPPDKHLLADLCAPKWSMSGVTLRVESREEILKRIGRSPDWASAYVLALIDTPKHHLVMGSSLSANRTKYDPYARMGTRAG